MIDIIKSLDWKKILLGVAALVGIAMFFDTEFSSNLQNEPYDVQKSKIKGERKIDKRIRVFYSQTVPSFMAKTETSDDRERYTAQAVKQYKAIMKASREHKEEIKKEDKHKALAAINKLRNMKVYSSEAKTKIKE